MKKRTILILEDDSLNINNGIVLFKMTIDEEQIIPSSKWRSLLAALVSAFGVDETNVVFGCDYYRSRLKEIELEEKAVGWLLDRSEFEDTSDKMKIEIFNTKKSLEKALSEELPNPLNE